PYSPFERYLHAICVFKPIVYFAAQLLNHFLMVGTSNQVVHFMGIRLQIVKLICIPNAMITDKLIAIRSDTVHGWCLRKVVLPIVFIKNPVAPLYFFPLKQRNE